MDTQMAINENKRKEILKGEFADKQKPFCEDNK